MLTEGFIASIQAGPKSAASSSLPKEAAIFLHDFQPVPSLKGALKKSSTAANCLATTATHIFAAQSDKALIHVYNRTKGNQETFIPFPFRITSIVRIGDEDEAAILALGTESGGLLLWELCTGRLVSTDPSHLQSITCLAVDPTRSFLLSGSADSSIQVWSIPGILSFADPGTGESAQASRGSPLRHLSTHRGAITSIVTGHSHTNADFAISASEDKTCLVWDYRTGDVLHTFLILEVPLCVALDPADRGFYVGLADGGLQFVNFHKAGSSIHLLYDSNHFDTPTQVAESDRWRSATSVGAALSISVSYDGTNVLTGHDSGKVLSWEIGRPPSEISDLGQPVTNLTIVPPTGFPNERKSAAGIKQITVVKPRPDAFPYTAGSGLSVPQNYNFTASFAEPLAIPRFTDANGNDTLMADFDRAIEDEYFPEDLLQAAVAETTDLEAGVDANERSGSDEVAQLKAQLKQAERQQRELTAKLTEANREIDKHEALARMKQRAASTIEPRGDTDSVRKRSKQAVKKSGDQALNDVDIDEEMGR